MDFKRIDKKYRPVPFWSWNEKLDVASSRCRIAEMEKADIGGFFRDSSFQKLDVSGMLQIGENVIETQIRFAQTEETYENIRKARIFESEKNKLTYDMEIEAMYLWGISVCDARADGRIRQTTQPFSTVDLF